MIPFKLTAAQGEVNIRKIHTIPENLKPISAENGLLIVGHSESGHHHGFRADQGVTVMERTEHVPEGMKILYAILENPTALIQDAPAPHDPLMLDAGTYEIRISREYNPFAEQARKVAD